MFSLLLTVLLDFLIVSRIKKTINITYSGNEKRCKTLYIYFIFITSILFLITDFTLVGVRVGVHNLRIESACVKDVNGTEICPNYQDIFVESSHYHPQFSKDSKQNDIALLRLEKEIDFKFENVDTICLPIGSAKNLQHKKVNN